MASLLASPMRPAGTVPVGAGGPNGGALPGLALPQMASWSQPPLPSYQPPNPGTFSGTAPTPTPYGAFTAPDQATFNRSADSLYLQGQQQKAIQRSGAARGTLLSGGLLGRLQQNAVGLASQDYNNQFNRDLAGYTANRDTNAQNFNQQLGAFDAGLGAFRANTDATLGSGRLGLDASYGNYDRAYRASQDARDYQQAINDRNAIASIPNPLSLGGFSSLSSAPQNIPQYQSPYLRGPKVPGRRLL